MSGHGTIAGYVRKCRCAPCREAMKVYKQQWRAAIAARVASGDAKVPHGTHGGYNNYACRCRECRAAAVAYHRARRTRLGR